MTHTRLVLLIMVASISLTACDRGKSRKNKSRPSAARLVPPGQQNSPTGAPVTGGSMPPPPDDGATATPERQKIVNAPVAGGLRKQELFSPGAPGGDPSDSAPVTDLTVKGGTSSGGTITENSPAPKASPAEKAGGEVAHNDGQDTTGAQAPGGNAPEAAATKKSEEATGEKAAAEVKSEKQEQEAERDKQPKTQESKDNATKTSQTACTKNHHRDDRERWSPGVPFELASQPRFTLGKETVALKVAGATSEAKADTKRKSDSKGGAKKTAKPPETSKKGMKTAELEDDSEQADESDGSEGVMLAAASSSKKTPDKSKSQKGSKKKKTEQNTKTKKKTAKKSRKSDDGKDGGAAVGTAKAKGASKNEVELKYTDAAVDGLMKIARDKTEALPKFKSESIQSFATRIQDIKFFSNAETGESKILVILRDDQNKDVEIALKGEPSGGGSLRLDFVLSQVLSGPQKAQFSANASCDDFMRGCKNVLIRLHQLNSAGKIIRVAYIIHREGPVHVTIGNRDLKLDAIKNAARREFVSLLQNTSQSACLNILDLASATKKDDQRRDFGSCMMERKQFQCGKSGTPSAGRSAEDFVLRAWSVAYGKAGFEWIATKRKVSSLLDYDRKEDTVFSISGPLAISDHLPMVPPHLVHLKSEDPHIKDLVSMVTLNANDGGGNLNIYFNFKGSNDKASRYTRISLTGLFDDHKVQNSAIAEMAQMPDIAADRFADKEEPGEAIVMNGQ